MSERTRLRAWDRDEGDNNHAHALSNAIREGVLSNCMSGGDKTFFKKAGIVMGVEAWRRISRFIGHDRDICLGTLRGEVRMIRGRFAIKSLE